LLYVQNENHAFLEKNASGTGLSRKSLKNGRCRRQKQNCDLRLAEMVLWSIVDANYFKKSFG
jgi:hypothetical protein